MHVVRLQPNSLPLARETFAMMGEVFAEDSWITLSDEYLTDILGQARVWMYAAVAADGPIGGLTAHQLPMTRSETSELLIYDLAIRSDWQRRGVGRALLQQLLDDASAAGIGEVWVPADDTDLHALEFYRRTGGASQSVTIFTYPTR